MKRLLPLLSGIVENAHIALESQSNLCYNSNQVINAIWKEVYVSFEKEQGKCYFGLEIKSLRCRMNHQDYKTTREWQALNRIWKNSSKEVQQNCYEDFKLITQMIQSNCSHRTERSRERNGNGYLNSLSEAAKGFIHSHSPNLYHSFMAVLDNTAFDSEEKLIEYYLEKYRAKRPYLEEHQELVREVGALCFSRYQRKHKEE